MNLKICSVFDSAAGVFGRPFFVPSTAVAVRSFRDEVMRDEIHNDLHKHPNDFVLYQLGEFDDNSGGFVVLDRPGVLHRAIDVKGEGE